MQSTRMPRGLLAGTSYGTGGDLVPLAGTLYPVKGWGGGFNSLDVLGRVGGRRNFWGAII